jgi:hypothetical protein
MTPRHLRPSLLLFAAFCWIASPAVVTAGPGAGAHGGGSSGGGHASSGGHSGGHASGSIGHASASSGAHYSGPSVYAGGYRSGASAGSFASNFVGISPATSVSTADGRNAATNAALARMASNGWNFAPSSGVTRAVPARPASMNSSARSPIARVPVVVPPRGPFPRPRPPFATGVIIGRPFYGFNGGSCFFNGFTSVCGFGFGGFGSSFYGPFGGCGFGFDCADGYGYYNGGGYSGEIDSSMYSPDEGPQNSGRMDIYGGYSPDALSQPSSADDTVPAQPPTQVILKNGTAFAVRSYWVFNGELYYKPVTGGVSHVPLDQLDLAATVQANSRNGVSFTLSEHP